MQIRSYVASRRGSRWGLARLAVGGRRGRGHVGHWLPQVQANWATSALAAGPCRTLTATTMPTAMTHKDHAEQRHDARRRRPRHADGDADEDEHAHGGKPALRPPARRSGSDQAEQAGPGEHRPAPGAGRTASLRADDDRARHGGRAAGLVRGGSHRADDGRGHADLSDPGRGRPAGPAAVRGPPDPRRPAASADGVPPHRRGTRRDRPRSGPAGKGVRRWGHCRQDAAGAQVRAAETGGRPAGAATSPALARAVRRSRWTRSSPRGRCCKA